MEYHSLLDIDFIADNDRIVVFNSAFRFSIHEENVQRKFLNQHLERIRSAVRVDKNVQY